MTNDTKHLRAEMDMAPVWDARVDLQRIAGILGAVIYLIHREDDNGERDEIVTALIALQEHLSNLADGLNGAVKGMQVVPSPAA